MRMLAWRPIIGCSFASTGCANCTALKGAPADLTRRGKGWTGETRLVPEVLDVPRRAEAPTAWFVCEHGDLFHAATPDDWIDRVFDVMEACPRHSFQILSKRAARMGAYLAARYGGRTAPAHLAFGVSAERQRELDARAPVLRAAPVAVRFVALYPLLGPVDLTGHLAGLAMVQAGDEAQRPADPAWFAAAERQCRGAGVPFVRAGLLDAA